MFESQEHSEVRFFPRWQSYMHVTKELCDCSLETPVMITDTDNNQLNFEKFNGLGGIAHCKGPVKLIQQVKIAHSFLQSVSNLFHFII